MRIANLKRALSRKWLGRFIRRHQELKLGKPSGLDPKRAQAFNEATMKQHFELLRQVMEEHNIPWEHVYNMDEKGIQRGRRNVEQIKYVLHRSERPIYKLRSTNLELVTVIECVRADGESLKPAFIFPGKGFHKEWFEVDPDILICMSPNGWTDDALCAEWFRHSFIPQTNAKRTSDAPILLIYNGHGSHATPALVELALQHNIHLFCLPPHITHKLQPLDVGVFAQVANAWTKHCDAVCAETDREMRREDIVCEYMSIRKAAITRQLVQSAFRACGLNPMNPHVFKPEDFAPSKITSLHAHFPHSFPCTVVRSDDSPESASKAPADSHQPSITPLSSSEDAHNTPLYDDLFKEDPTDDTSEIGAGNSTSDEDWNSVTDEEVLHDDLSTRYEATHPPVVIQRLLSNAGHYNCVSDSIYLHCCPTLLVHLFPSPIRAIKPFRIYTTPPKHAGQLREVISGRTSDRELGSAYERAVRAQAEWLRDLTAQLESSRVHASMAALEAEDLQRKLNQRSMQKGKKSLTLVTDACCFTSGTGLEAWKAQEAERAEREVQKEAKKAARERKAEEQAALRRDLSYAYSGGLSKQLLPNLQALVRELGITLNASIKRPAKEVLNKAIQAYFEEHPECQDEDRYRGLSRQAQERPASESTDENKPPLRRPRLDAPLLSPSSPLQVYPSSRSLEFPIPQVTLVQCHPSQVTPSCQWPIWPLRGSEIANTLASSSDMNPVDFFSPIRYDASVVPSYETLQVPVPQSRHNPEDYHSNSSL
ncbi:hypothetical protein ACG7TL_005284 [Trametes sanguinea]